MLGMPLSGASSMGGGGSGMAVVIFALLLLAVSGLQVGALRLRRR